MNSSLVPSNIFLCEFLLLTVSKVSLLILDLSANFINCSIDSLELFLSMA